MNQKFGMGSIWRPLRLGAAGVSSETVGAGPCARPATRGDRRRATVVPRVAFRLPEGDCLRREALEDPVTGLGFRLGQAFYAWFNPHHLQSGRFQRPYPCRLQPFSIADPHLHDGEILELTHYQKFFKNHAKPGQTAGWPDQVSPSYEAARTARTAGPHTCRVGTLTDTWSFYVLSNQNLANDGAWVCARRGPGGARHHSPRLQPWERNRNLRSPGRAIQATPALPLLAPDEQQILCGWSELSNESCGPRPCFNENYERTQFRTSDLPSTAWGPIRHPFHSLRPTEHERKETNPISQKLLEINRIERIPRARDAQPNAVNDIIEGKDSKHKLWDS